MQKNNYKNLPKEESSKVKTLSNNWVASLKKPK